jgi:phosphopentomutase
MEVYTRFGHARDVEWFARHLGWLVGELATVAAALGPADRLVVTADHGNDPTFPGSDHTRENVPALVAGGRRRGWQGRADMAALGGALVEYFALPGGLLDEVTYPMDLW